MNRVKTIYKLAKGLHNEHPESELKKEAYKELEMIFEESKLDSTEYASMLRSFFRKNPVDF